MKVAIIGSRGLSNFDLSEYLPQLGLEITEIVSGGARGVDALAREFALKNGLVLTEFLPEYDRYGNAAPIRRNDLIVAYADIVVAFWDGHSRGTKYVIERCRETGKPCQCFELIGYA